MLVKENVNDNYLDATRLEVGKTYSKVGYLVSARSGMTVKENGFYTFYIKDVNANILTARLFNIVDFIEKGFVLEYLKKKPVWITFVAQEFNGSITLIIKEIVPYQLDIDYEIFVGKVEGAAEILKSLDIEIASRCEGFFFPYLYTITPLGVLYSGKCGGYVKVIEYVMNSLKSFESIKDIDTKVLYTTFYYVQKHYFNYLQRRSELDVLQPLELADLVGNIANELKGTTCAEIVVDTMMALTNMSIPKHLYANILFQLFKTAEQLYGYIEMYKLMPLASTKEVGDAVLVKY